MNTQPTYDELLEKIQRLEQEILIDNRSELFQKRDAASSKQFYEALPLPYHSLNGNGYVLEVNQTWLDTLGYLRKSVIGQHFTDFLYGKWKQFFIDNFPDFKAAGSVHGVELVMIKQNGSQVFTIFNGTVERYANGDFNRTHCIFNDVTQQKKDDEERLLLKTVIEQAEENVLITDNRRTILYVNPAFERSSGYIRDELKGQKLRCLRSDQQDKAFYQTTKDILDRGDVWMGLIVNRGKNGVDFEIEGSISPIRNTAGVITHYVAVGRNMSRFRKLERDLQHAQKLDSIGTLAGGIAHDFNNVLTAIMGFIEMEYITAVPESQTRHRMERALKACHRARDLIKQILAFSRQDPQRKTPVNVFHIVTDALKMLRASIPTTIDIRPPKETQQSTIMGDSTQIHQVVVNLCINAAHAMLATGGILDIDLRDIEIDAETPSESRNLQPGYYVHLTVRDTGYGMSQETLSRIFEPFYTTKGPGEGSGIGLAIVRGIIRNHGGVIVAESEPGKGSAFHVYFPRSDGAVTTMDISQTQFPTGNERILLVDDEEIITAVETDMLKSLGYEVVSVNRSSDALEKFRSQRSLFHLVITDLTMPGMTGLELATELLKIRNDIPIILCTGFPGAGIREKALSLGIMEIMVKPFVLQEMAHTIRRILDIRD